MSANPLHESPVYIRDLGLDILKPKSPPKNPWRLVSVGVRFFLVPLPDICCCSTLSHLPAGAGCSSCLGYFLYCMGIRQAQALKFSWARCWIHTISRNALYQTLISDLSGNKDSRKFHCRNQQTVTHLIKDKTFSLRPGFFSSPSLHHSQYHAGCAPAEEHVPQAECAAAGIRPGMGSYAVALHCAAASTSEQHWATWADLGAQSAICQGPDRGEPECARGATGNVHGWLW